jgi:hypothetical protein
MPGQRYFSKAHVGPVRGQRGRRASGTVVLLCRELIGDSHWQARRRHPVHPAQLHRPRRRSTPLRDAHQRAADGHRTRSSTCGKADHRLHCRLSISWNMRAGWCGRRSGLQAAPPTRSPAGVLWLPMGSPPLARSNDSAKRHHALEATSRPMPGVG